MGVWNRGVRLACGAALLTGSALAAPPSPGPKLPFVDNGACPFECCTYREWKTEKPVTLRAGMSAVAPIVALIPAHQTVRALTGAVITAKPGIVRILKPLTIGQTPDGKPILSVKAGEQLYTLHNEGEGVMLFWHGGRTYSEQIDPNGDAPVKFASRPVTAWWAKIKTRDGKIGWTNQTADFSNTDSCG